MHVHIYVHTDIVIAYQGEDVSGLMEQSHSSPVEKVHECKSSTI